MKKLIAINVLRNLHEKIHRFKRKGNIENNCNGSIISVDDPNPVEKIFFSNETVKIVKKENLEITNLLKNFYNLERIRSDENIIEYWKRNQYFHEDLNEMACVLLAIPSTQVSVERSFSDLGYICNKLRNKLDENIINDIIFLRILERFNK